MKCRNCKEDIDIVNNVGWRHHVEDGPDAYTMCRCKCEDCTGKQDLVSRNTPCCDGDEAQP